MSQERGVLSPRQLKACEEFLVDYSPVNAMLRAGYAKSSANKCSAVFFRRPQVQAKLQELSRNISAKTMVTAEKVLSELMLHARANLMEYYKKGKKKGTFVIKDPDEMTEEQQRCIAEYNPEKGYIKLHNKDGALDKLAKHFKLYTEIDASINNFVIMPSLKIQGKEVVFEIGQPAPQIKPQLQNRN